MSDEPRNTPVEKEQGENPAAERARRIQEGQDLPKRTMRIEQTKPLRKPAPGESRPAQPGEERGQTLPPRTRPLIRPEADPGVAKPPPTPPPQPPEKKD
jgi:hypothetical protein